MQTGNYFLKHFESGIAPIPKQKTLDLKRIAPNAALFTSIHLNGSEENIDISSQVNKHH